MSTAVGLWSLIWLATLSGGTELYVRIGTANWAAPIDGKTPEDKGSQDKGSAAKTDAAKTAAAQTEPAASPGSAAPATAQKSPSTAPDSSRESAPAGSTAESTTPMLPQDLADWIDTRCEQSWPAGETERRPLVDDATFLRRVMLDLTGTIPTVSTTRDFLNKESPQKRPELVSLTLGLTGPKDRMSNRGSAHFARLFRRMLVPGNGPDAQMATRLDPWLETQFASNTHYDQLARELILAKPVPQPMPAVTTNALGYAPAASGPAVLFEAVGGTPVNLANSFTRAFLGVRIGCAQCHNHPFAQWTQDDFWGMAAFFAGSSRGRNGEWTDARLFTIRNEANSKQYSARFLWDEPSDFTSQSSDKGARATFADWMTSRENPNFSATAVNRIWQILCGRGLTDAVDDLDTASPAERKMLNELAEKFEAAQYDVRWLVAGICISRTYQRVCPVEESDAAPHLTGVRPVKILLPEQLYDSLEQALALPVSRLDNGPRFNGQRTELIVRMNEALGNTPEEFKGGVPQALLLMNGELVRQATSLEESRTLRAVVEAPFLDETEKLDTLFLATLTRFPRDDEQQFLMSHIRSQTEPAARKQAYAEILWGLLNSPEFVLSR